MIFALAFSNWRTLRAGFRRTLAGLVLLSASTAQAGSNVVEYTYDAAGNITNIVRQAAVGFAITGFTPGSGAVGSAVTIYGTGFSTTIANNTVKFNGITATVSEAQTGSLSVVVPSGATTGRISVTVGAQTATSAQDFAVVIPGAPTITAFAPGYGAAGASVAVTGTNFNATAGATTVKLNGFVATATVADAGSLTFTVPASVGSGRITATTSIGTGTSATDFLIPPPGIAGADIISVRRLPLATPTNFSVYVENKHAVLLFDGTTDGFYTLQFTNFQSPTTAPIPYKVFKPDGTLLAQGGVGNTGRPTIHLPRLPVDGTYSVLLSPGIATLNSTVTLNSDPTIVVDGAVRTSEMTVANQSQRWIFNATAGDRLGIGLSGVSLSPVGTATTAVRVVQPSGTDMPATTLPACTPNVNNPQGLCDGELVAPATGTYQLIAESPSSAYSSFSIYLNSEIGGSLALDAVADATLGRPGQDARYTFTVATGDSVGVKVFAIAPQPTAQSFNVGVYKPDGSLFTSCAATPPAAAYCELGSLAAAGTYSVVVDPALGTFGTFKLAAERGPLLATTDAPTSFTSSAASEPMRIRFSAAAGQNLGLAVAGYANVSGSGVGDLVVFKPDKTPLTTSVSCNPLTAGGRCKHWLINLPSTGTYSAVITPVSGLRGTGNVSVSSELTGSLTVGTPQSINATRNGQSARYTFAGTIGDSVGIRFFGLTTSPASLTVTVTVLRPNGSVLTSANVSTSNAVVLNLATLATTGTYSVVVEPFYGQPWSGLLSIDAGVPISVNGTSQTPTSSVAGEPIRYAFDGSSGQRLELGMAGLSYASPSASTTAVSLHAPDGSLLASASCATSGAASCEAVANLTTTGKHAIVVSPPSASLITAGALSVSTPATGALVIGDPAQTVTIARPGQTARFAFSGTAAQLLRLSWSGASVSSGSTVTVSVLKPDGSTLNSSSLGNGATGSLDVTALPTTGTYTVVFDPSVAGTLSVPVTLATR